MLQRGGITRQPRAINTSDIHGTEAYLIGSELGELGESKSSV